MGVWGTGVFESDEAQDLVGEVEARGLRPLRQPIRAITSAPQDEIIDEDLASRGVAAAALIGHALGLKIGTPPDEIQQALEDGQLKCTASDAKLAGEAIERVLNHSYLEQAWTSADRKVWRKELSRLLSGLKSLADKPAKARAPAKQSISPKSGATKPRAGDVLLIPIADDEYVVAKILYAFRAQKRCLLIEVTNTVTRSLAMPAAVSEKTVARLYTTDVEIAEGVWHKVGELPLTENEQKASLRLLGDGVWFGDEFVHTATEKDLAILPQMSPGGGIATEYHIRVAMGRCLPGSVLERASIWHLHARICLGRKELQKAITYLDMALRDDPKLAAAYWDRAKAWDNLGKREKAESDRQRALVLDPSLSASSESAGPG